MAPRWFWSVQIIFGLVPIAWLRSNSFWSGPNHYGQVQIIKISLEKSNLNLTKILWPRPKQFGPNQNNLHLSKTIWTVQNHFGPIEGQGINMVFHGKTSLKRALVRTALFLNIAGRLGKIFIRSWLSEQEHWTTRKNARLKQLLDYWLSDRVIHLDFQNTSIFP